MQDFATAELANDAAEMERELLRFAPDSPDQQEMVLDEIFLSSQLSIGSYWDRGERYALLFDIEAFYAAHGAGFEGGASPVSLNEVQEALRPDEAVIEYWIPYHSTHPALSLWVIRTRRPRARRGTSAHGLFHGPPGRAEHLQRRIVPLRTGRRAVRIDAGLARCGAENVLGTLWPLEDTIGRFFMQDVYTSLLPPYDPTEARFSV